MTTLTKFQDYCKMKGISERYLYLQIKAGKIIPFREGREKYVIEAKPEIVSNPEVNKLIREEKKREYNERIKQIGVRVKTQGRDSESVEMVKEILTEISELKKLGIIVKGFTQRSIQRKVFKVAEFGDELQRKTRADKFQPRVKLLREKPEVLETAIQLTAAFYMADPLRSLSNAIERVRAYAETEEDLWEVRALNYFTMRRHIDIALKQSGHTNLHDFMNHHNIWRKKLPFTQGAFTHDTEFMEEYQIDDRKIDIAGCWVWNEERGKLELKKAEKWAVIETTTMKVLGYAIKGESFTSEDLVLMMMGVFKKYGLPKRRIVYDNGLMKSERCETFFQRAGVVAERAKPYSGTDKAMRERMNKFQKDETDIYMMNFTGSNHPVEGRHTTERLSPEQEHELLSEVIKRYDEYFNGYYLNKPRKLGIPWVDHLRDNTGRVSIEQAWDEGMKNHVTIPCDERKLRYAYQKTSSVSFSDYMVRFKGSIYLPEEPLSPAIHEPGYTFTVCYDPTDLSSIDVYSNQDIIDRIFGEEIHRTQYVATLRSVMSHDKDEKKAKVARHIKAIKKQQLKLAESIGDAISASKDMINKTVSASGRVNDERKEMVKDIERVIKRGIPLENIDVIETEVDKEKTVKTMDVDTAMSDEVFSTLPEFKLD